jgi:uncharacterized protein YqeY
MFNTFKADVLAMRKSKSPLASTMVFHLAEIKQLGKKENREPTSEEAVQYIKKAVFKLNQEKFSNPHEIAILSKYLPVMATEQELLAVITPVLEGGGGTGDVMKAVKLEFGVRADMAMVRKLC